MNHSIYACKILNGGNHTYRSIVSGSTFKCMATIKISSLFPASITQTIRTYSLICSQ